MNTNTMTMILAAGMMAGSGTACAHGKIYTYESDANGFNTKNYFYDNGQEVVAFDAQFTPELAEKSIAYLRTQTLNPVTYLVITHPNSDKFNGISAFKKLGAKVVASQKTADAMPGVHAYKKYFFVNMAKMFTEESYPQLDTIDQTFERSMDLALGNGETIQLQELSQPGVSSNQTVAMIPQTQAAVVGDLVHHRVHAWLEGGIVNGKPTPTLAGWIADLRELQGLIPSDILVYGGRGEVATASVSLPEQIQYLERADQLASQYVSELSKGSEPDFQQLQSRFEQEFPGYGLGYMIQYGAYGLVNSKR